MMNFCVSPWSNGSGRAACLALGRCPAAPNWAGTDLRQLGAPTLRASGFVARLRSAARSIFLSSFKGLETPQMKFESACPSKIVLVVDHIGLVGVTVGCTSASVASFDVAQRRLALCVAVVLADMKLSIIIIHQQIRGFVERLLGRFDVSAPVGHLCLQFHRDLERLLLLCRGCGGGVGGRVHLGVELQGAIRGRAGRRRGRKSGGRRRRLDDAFVRVLLRLAQRLDMSRHGR